MPAIALKKVITETVINTADQAARSAKSAARAKRLAESRTASINDVRRQIEADVSEYDVAMSKVDSERLGTTEVREETLRVAAEDAEFTRRVGINDPKAQTDAVASQTLDVEEFTNRLNNQLRDPDYAARNTFPDAGPAPRDAIVASTKRHEENASRVLGVLESNPRWKGATDDWFGDSPYKGDVQFHVDRMTDPTRPNSFIQFDEPWEFGLHSGTNDAAERTIHGGGMDAVLRNQQEQAESIIQIAGELDIPVRQIESTMAQAAERHLVRKFTKNGDVNIWDEIREILDTFVDSFGSFDITNSFIAGLKSMPTPSTTPFLFRGRNGLLLQDAGGFKAQGVGNQLERIFNSADDVQAIDKALSATGETAKQQELIKFIESKGHDHILYYNSVEDKGSLSLINWNEDLMASPWDRRFNQGPADQARVAAQYILGVLGLGGSASAIVREQEQGT